MKKPRKRKPKKEPNKSYPIKIFAVDALRMAEERVKADGTRAHHMGLRLTEREQRLSWVDESDKPVKMDPGGFFVYIDALTGEIDIPKVL